MGVSTGSQSSSERIVQRRMPLRRSMSNWLPELVEKVPQRETGSVAKCAPSRVSWEIVTCTMVSLPIGFKPRVALPNALRPMDWTKYHCPFHTIMVPRSKRPGSVDFFGMSKPPCVCFSALDKKL